MNNVREIERINEIELKNGVSYEASWHYEYRDSNYIFIGSLPFELTEGDILAVFSQYGVPIYIKLIRDSQTGKSKGICYLEYEEFNSCILAVDNFNGIRVLGQVIRVDHCRYEKKKRYNRAGEEILDPNEKIMLQELQRNFLE
ncbi:U2 snRNP complex subunit IST3 [Ascoidea rubescens DSM 1968]|uniref:RNA-binding domain-containing protein n=1 Tax=Ascoidea rubescens DSM 1968 TaxID=1344418 RepID=A0A1D2VIL1_9ASCO|nr:RNA-binding domain-containing protein [Ascoidea rubescens DSM 1968]ODV61327.1 RNA-binding domain-containing protein [Ascoidea rubescens DSM 1968]